MGVGVSALFTDRHQWPNFCAALETVLTSIKGEHLRRLNKTRDLLLGQSNAPLAPIADTVGIVKQGIGSATCMDHP